MSKSSSKVFKQQFPREKWLETERKCFEQKVFTKIVDKIIYLDTENLLSLSPIRSREWLIVLWKEKNNGIVFIISS